MCGSFSPHYLAVLHQQLGVLQLNSVQMLSTQRESQTPRVQVSVLQECSHFRRQSKSRDQPAVNQRFPQHSSSWIHLLEQLTELRETFTSSPVYSARWERRTEQVRGKGREASLPSELYILCESPWIYQLAVLQTLFFLVVMEALLLSVQFRSVTPSDSLWPHGLQHAKPPYPSPTPRVYSNSCPLADAIQPSHPLSSLSSPVFNLSQHRGLFKRVSSSHQVAEALEFQLQHQSFQRISRTDLLFYLGVID